MEDPYDLPPNPKILEVYRKSSEASEIDTKVSNLGPKIISASNSRRIEGEL